MAAAIIVAGTVVHAQSVFRYVIDDLDPSTLLFCRSVVPIGPDAYRLAATRTLSGETEGFVCMDLHADGSVTNAFAVPLDTNAASYLPMTLPTADGGHLYAYLWVADGTDKQVFLKVDASGNVLWNRYYPDNYGLLLIDVEQGMVEKDGHYFVFGHLQAVAPTEGWACVLLELDSVGALVAHRQFAGGDAWSDSPKALIHNRSGGLTTVSALHPYSGVSSYPQIAVQRWDALLGLEWSRQFSFGNYHLLSSVNELSDGGLLFTGTVRLSFGSGPFFPFIFKVDTLGEVVWSRRGLNALQLLNDVVAMADGSFLAVGQTWTNETLIAHLDSVGGLIDARLSTTTGTGVPTELIHDTIANEFLVRFRALPKLVRLDATLQLDCNELPYTWPDTLVWPSAFDFPITQTTGSMLVNFDSVVVSQPIFMTAYDPCLGTTVPEPDLRSPLSAWPMPTSGSLTIGPLNGSMERTTYRLVDALGRVMLHGSAPADRSDLVLDLGALAAGRYVLVVDVGGNQERIQVMKL